MHKFASDHFADRSRGEISGLFYQSVSLRDHASSEFIPVAADARYRNLRPSKAAKRERQRSALEALLTGVAPTNAAQMATALIQEFRTLKRVFAESPESVERVVGPNSAVTGLLQAAQFALLEALFWDVPAKLVSTTDQRLIDYLLISVDAGPQEILRVLFFDRGNHVIGDEILATGSIATITAHPRNIFRRAFELGAASILLVHNHPGGSVEPSKCDIQFTTKIIALGRSLEVDIKDHIIIAGGQWFSFLRQGLL